MFAKKFSNLVPDYRITIHMKVGLRKEGIRWHPSYEVEHVRALVEKKVKRTIGMAAVKLIEVALVSHSNGGRSASKNLTMEWFIYAMASRCRETFVRSRKYYFS